LEFNDSPGCAVPYFQFNQYRSCFICIFNIASSGVGKFRMVNLSDRYSPSVDPQQALATAAVLVRGRSDCKTKPFLFFSGNCSNVSGASAGDRKGAPNSYQAKLVVRVLNTSVSPPIACTADFGKRLLPEWNQTMAYDLLNGCQATINGQTVKPIKTNADLLGAQMDTEFYMYRNKRYVGGCRNGGDFSFTSDRYAGNDCGYWRYFVDYVGLATTAAPTSSGANPDVAWQGPKSQFEVESNDLQYLPDGVTPNPRAARFNVYGAVIAPRSDVRINWTGPSPTGVPIFSAPPKKKADDPDTVKTDLDTSKPVLMVNSIYSYMASPQADLTALTATDLPRVGPVCCNTARPAERLVELRAHVLPSASLKVPTKSTTSLPLAQEQIQIRCFDQQGVKKAYDYVKPAAQGGNLPAAVASLGPASVQAWTDQVWVDWAEYCRGRALRAVSKVRIVDQVPDDPKLVPAAYKSRLGSWEPGWSVEVEDFKFCQRGSSISDCSRD
jgi:hypothetical protein